MKDQHTVYVNYSHINSHPESVSTLVEGYGGFITVTLPTGKPGSYMAYYDKATSEIIIEIPADHNLAFNHEKLSDTSSRIYFYIKGNEVAKKHIEGKLKRSRFDFFKRLVDFACQFHPDVGIQQQVLKAFYYAILKNTKENKELFATLSSYNYDKKPLLSLYFCIQPYDSEEFAYIPFKSLEKIMGSPEVLAIYSPVLSTEDVSKYTSSLVSLLKHQKTSPVHSVSEFVKSLSKNYDELSGQIRTLVRHRGFEERLLKNPKVGPLECFVAENYIASLLGSQADLKSAMMFAQKFKLKVVPESKEMFATPSFIFDATFSSLSDKMIDPDVSISKEADSNAYKSLMVSNFMSHYHDNNFFFITNK